MHSTKTLIPLALWHQAVHDNDTHILLLASKGRIVVYDANRNFLTPVCRNDAWELVAMEEESLLT